jgi:hypothetical protein
VNSCLISKRTVVTALLDQAYGLDSSLVLTFLVPQKSCIVRTHTIHTIGSSTIPLAVSYVDDLMPTFGQLA